MVNDRGHRSSATYAKPLTIDEVDSPKQVPTPARSSKAASPTEPSQKTSRKRAASSSPKKETAKKRKASTEEDDNDDSDAAFTSLFNSNPFTDRAKDTGKPTPSFPDTGRNDTARIGLNKTGADPAESKRFMELLKVLRQNRLGFKSDKIEMKGIVTPLFYHQAEGAALIRMREKSEEADDPQGGILADDMGLGKTLTMLTAIFNGFRESPNGMTLVVASDAIISEWEDQVTERFNNPNHAFKRISRYSGLSRGRKYTRSRISKQNDIVRKVTKHHLVFATYHEVRESWPFTGSDEESEITLGSHRSRSFNEGVGPLHRIKWERVVFDEAHTIKNYRAKTTKAFFALNVAHVWFMSGTPLQNGVEEAYSYFRTLRMPHTATLKDFKAHYLADGMTLLKERLRQDMIRRTYKSEILGKSIVTIPETTFKPLAVGQPEAEAKIYKAVEAKLVEKIDEVKQNSALNDEQKRAIVLAMIVRLRQLVMHPLLVCHIIGMGHKDSILELIQESNKEHPVANATLTEEKAAKMCNMVQASVLRDGLIGTQKDCNQKRKKRKRAPGKDSSNRHGCRNAKGKARFSINRWLKKGGQLPHSSKTAAVTKLISDRLEADSSRRFSVFTQSLEIIEILAQIFRRHKWGHAKHSGRMSHKSRRKALDDFKKNPETSVLIMSLLAGGEGLNLPAASCVINMDLWWNWAREKQAYMRPIRMNQTRETEIIRLYTKSTIDTKVKNSQSRKFQDIEHAMSSGGKRAKDLSLDELIGMVGEDTSPAEDAARLFDGDADIDVTFPSDDLDVDPDFEDDGDGEYRRKRDIDTDSDDETASDSEESDDLGDSDVSSDSDDDDDDELVNGKPKWALRCNLDEIFKGQVEDLDPTKNKSESLSSAETDGAKSADHDGTMNGTVD